MIKPNHVGTGSQKVLGSHLISSTCENVAKVSKTGISKAELARQLGVSRAYIIMLSKGERTPSKRLQKRINKLARECSLPASFRLLPKQDVEDSNPFTRFVLPWLLLQN